MADAVPDFLERQIILKAPRSRVFRALADSKEFGAWFGADFKEPFAPGARLLGKITTPGYQQYTIDVLVEEVTPETRFSYRWHPAALDLAHDYSAEPRTLVEFLLEDAPGGTRLTLRESGFSQLSLPRQAEAFRLNLPGWIEQVQRIARYVES